MEGAGDLRLPKQHHQPYFFKTLLLSHVDFHDLPAICFPAIMTPYDMYH